MNPQQQNHLAELRVGVRRRDLSQGAGGRDRVQMQGLGREGKLDSQPARQAHDLEKHVVSLTELFAPGRHLEEEVEHHVQRAVTEARHVDLVVVLARVGVASDELPDAFTEGVDALGRRGFGPVLTVCTAVTVLPTGIVPGVLLLTVGANFTGYLLPWDQLAYWAVTVSIGMLDYLPLAGAALQELITKHKVDLKRFPEDLLAGLRKLAQEVLEEEANKDAASRKVHEAYKKFKEQVGVWGSVSENAYYNVIADKYKLKA